MNSLSTKKKVLLDRLKTKDVEWRKQRLEMNVVWRDVQEKNYQKSLDHRSFYFKQNERKNLAIKSLLNEIKETGREGRINSIFFN